MSVLVTDTGFSTDDWQAGYTPLEEGTARALDVPSDADPDSIPLSAEVEMIRVAFPSFADGRGGAAGGR